MTTRVATLALNLSDPLFSKASGFISVNDHGLTESNVVRSVAPNAATIRVARLIARAFEIIFIRAAKPKVVDAAELGRLFTSCVPVSTKRSKTDSTEFIFVTVSVSLTELSRYILAVTIRNRTSRDAGRIFIAAFRASAVGDIADLSI